MDLLWQVLAVVLLVVLFTGASVGIGGLAAFWALGGTDTELARAWRRNTENGLSFWRNVHDVVFK